MNYKVFVSITITIIVGVFGILVEPQWQIYYNIKTNKTIDTLDGGNPRLKIYGKQQNKILRIGFGPIPCSCEGLQCGCCAGMNISMFNFNRRACMNFTYVPSELAIDMGMYMDEELMYSNMVSGKNPPPVCVPVPIPWIPSVDFCLKFFNVHTIDYNLFMCMDFVTRMERAPLLILHFDCMELGQDGVSYHKPDEEELEIEADNDDSSDVFDEVNEDDEDVNQTDIKSNKSAVLKEEESATEMVVVVELVDGTQGNLATTSTNITPAVEQKYKIKKRLNY